MGRSAVAQPNFAEERVHTTQKLTQNSLTLRPATEREYNTAFISPYHQNHLINASRIAYHLPDFRKSEWKIGVGVRRLGQWKFARHGFAFGISMCCTYKFLSSLHRLSTTEHLREVGRLSHGHVILKGCIECTRRYHVLIPGSAK